MPAKNKCPELEKIPRIIETISKPIPADCLAHARRCEDCLFWLSHMLALRKAMSLITTRILIKGLCPEQGSFSLMLIAAVQALKTIPDALNKKTAKNFWHLTLGEEPMFSEVFELRWHLDECELCESYYAELYDKMIDLQEEYEAEIKKDGAEIIPAPQAEIREIDFSELQLHKQTKPN